MLRLELVLFCYQARQREYSDSFIYTLACNWSIWGFQIFRIFHIILGFQKNEHLFWYEDFCGYLLGSPLNETISEVILGSLLR